MLNSNDIYSTITQKIICDLEKGELTWRKPWIAENLTGNAMLPLRYNNIPYSGINTIMLWATAVEKGYASPYWMTFKQAFELKAHIRKGEKGTQVIYADKIAKEKIKEDGTSDIQHIPYLKLYTVFNASQIDGLPDNYNKLPEAKIINPETRDPKIDNFIAQTKANIFPGKQAAYYQSFDKIEMPPFEAFNNAASYYGTLSHELAHWTKHPSRLNRDFNSKKWGDEYYAKEELVAELAACFLGADLGFEPVTKELHSAYIQSWLKVLNNDTRFIIQAASQAQKAVEYMNELQNKVAPVQRRVVEFELI